MRQTESSCGTLTIPLGTLHRLPHGKRAAHTRRYLFTGPEMSLRLRPVLAAFESGTSTKAQLRRRYNGPISRILSPTSASTKLRLLSLHPSRPIARLSFSICERTVSEYLAQSMAVRLTVERSARHQNGSPVCRQPCRIQSYGGHEPGRRIRRYSR